MCGILGQIRFKDNGYTPLNLNLLAHRGPDGRGEWTNNSGNVYLGHTRLAILDPTPTGQQPMRNSTNRFTITFNGEIYNHLELRGLLPNFQWRGTSDTETLVELFNKFGLECLSFIKGMFAFAIYDALEDIVFLVRDRLGIKPLWFRIDEYSLNFSSEVKALNVTNDLHFNNKALSEYIAFGRMPIKGEVFCGIQSLEPGGWLKISVNKKLEFKKWWPKEKYSIIRDDNQKDISKYVKKLVSNAIEEHLISDVGVGAFLSGGIDSSIITLEAGKKIGQNLKTFTIIFSNSSYDERTFARMVAKKAGTDHYEIEVKEEESLHWVLEAVKNLDLPSVDAINTYIVSKAVRNSGLKVALSGLGGDELFGGYPSFKSVPLLKWLDRLPKNFRQQIVKSMPFNIQQKLSGLLSYSIIDLSVARRRYVSIPDLKRMGFENGTPEISEPPADLDTTGTISWAEIQGYMIPMLLRDSDQMSMATGLELRVPFLDHTLVEEVLHIPEKFKRGPIIKNLLVDAFKEELPLEVYRRKKQGFELPMDNWIRKELASFTNEGITAVADYFQLPEPILVKRQFDNKNVHWSRVWNWCVLGQWLLQKNISISARFEWSQNFTLPLNKLYHQEQL